MKHAIFQPCGSQTLDVCCHFEFHQPLMMGKKKRHYVQFFTKITDASINLDKGSSSMLVTVYLFSFSSYHMTKYLAYLMLY